MSSLLYQGRQYSRHLTGTMVLHVFLQPHNKLGFIPEFIRQSQHFGRIIYSGLNRPGKIKDGATDSPAAWALFPAFNNFFQQVFSVRSFGH